MSSEPASSTPPAEAPAGLAVPSIKGVMRYIPHFLLRAVLPSAIIIAGFAVIPPVATGGKTSTIIVEVVYIVICLALFFPLYLVRQVKRIGTSDRPGAAWIEALTVVGALFVAIFAHLYRVISESHSAAFTQQMDILNSYYYSMTVLSTIGFGDIAPATPVAKIFTMLQMVCDLALIGLVVRVLASAASYARGRKANS